MNKALILAVAVLCILGATVGAKAQGKAFLWDGNHWQQVSLDGKAGYVFGVGNLADFETSAGRGKSACISRAFVDDLKQKTVMQIVQEVDKFYQDNPGKLSTTVIEVILQRCTKACPPGTSSGAPKK